MKPMTLLVRHQEDKDSPRCWQKACDDKVRNRISKDTKKAHALLDKGCLETADRRQDRTIITIISHSKEERQQVFMVSFYDKGREITNIIWWYIDIERMREEWEGPEEKRDTSSFSLLFFRNTP